MVLEERFHNNFKAAEAVNLRVLRAVKRDYVCNPGVRRSLTLGLGSSPRD